MQRSLLSFSPSMPTNQHGRFALVALPCRELRQVFTCVMLTASMSLHSESLNGQATLRLLLMLVFVAAVEIPCAMLTASTLTGGQTKSSIAVRPNHLITCGMDVQNTR